MERPPLTGRWYQDSRGEGRAVRVSAHAEAGFLVMSTWQADVCVASVRLLPDEAAELAGGIAAALASMAVAPTAVSSAGTGSA
ncbi:MAG: hypothetical protein ACLGIG_05400 [Actinomycetes bacterium]